MEMELRPRRRQRRKRRKAVVAEDVRSIHDLSDDLLRLILLRLDSPLWLIRASCTCKRWRRVITGEGDDADQGRAFLRLARSLHPPILVGQYQNVRNCQDHRFVPSSPPPPAPPIDDGSRFVDDLLLNKSRWGWHVVDCHRGLVLLRLLFGSASAPSHIVYDPLTRQHHAIYDPPLPKGYGYGVKDTWLLDGDDGDLCISNFRVIYRFGVGDGAAEGGPQTCEFSTANGQDDWRFPSQPAGAATGFLGQLAGRVDGCLYLALQTGSVVVLDNASLLFTKVELPIRIHEDASRSLFRRPSTFSVVDGGARDCGLGPTSPARTTTSIVHVRGEELELFRRGHGSGEWVLENSIANLWEATRGLLACLEKNMPATAKWRTMVDAIAADGAGLAILSARSLSRRQEMVNLYRRTYDGDAGVAGGALS